MASWRTSVAGGSTSGTGNRTVTITPAVGDLFIVCIAVAANAQDAPTCADNNANGGSYYRIDVGNWLIVAVNYRISLFVRDYALINTTSTTITGTTGSNTSGSIIVVAVSGMDRFGKDAIRQIGTQDNQTAGGTPAPIFPVAALTGNMCIGAIGNGTNPGGVTQPASWTSRHNVGFSNDALGQVVATRDSGETNSTITWGSTSASIFASIVAELDTSKSPGEYVGQNQQGQTQPVREPDQVVSY